MKCRRCNRNIPATAKFCRYCGARAGGPQRPPQQGGTRGRRRQQSGVNGYLILRIVLIVICVGLAGIGIWKIPGNIRRIAGANQTTAKEYIPEPLSPSEAAAIHEAVEQLNARNDAEVEDVSEPQEYVDPTISELKAERNYFHDQGKSWFHEEPTAAPDPEEVTEP